MFEVEFGDFNHGPYGDPDDQDEHGPVRAFGQHDQGDFLRGIAEAVLQLIIVNRHAKLTPYRRPNLTPPYPCEVHPS